MLIYHIYLNIQLNSFPIVLSHEHKFFHIYGQFNITQEGDFYHFNYLIKQIREFTIFI